MKVKQCHICGAKIDGENSLRVLIQGYTVHAHFSGYKTDETLHICEGCASEFKEKLRGCNNERISN